MTQKDDQENDESVFKRCLLIDINQKDDQGNDESVKLKEKEDKQKEIHHYV